MHIEPKQLKTLFLVCILLVLFSAYQFVYVNYNNKAEAIAEENISLQNRRGELQAKVNLETKFMNEINTANASMNEIKMKYGVGNTPEKSIRFILNMCKYSGMTIPTMSFSTDQLIFSSDIVPSKDNTGIYVYQNSLSLTYKSSYEALKRCMDFINQNEERMNVDSLSASFDSESGNLSGVLVINQYSMTGTESIYQKPQFDGINIGVDSIFGTTTILE